MNDKDRLDSYTPEERQALRLMLRDPSTVKDLFNQQRITFSNALEQIKALKARIPTPESLESDEVDLKARLDLNDMIEAMVLNQIQFREEIKEIVDSILANNMQKLREIRQQIDY